MYMNGMNLTLLCSKLFDVQCACLLRMFYWLLSVILNPKVSRVLNFELMIRDGENLQVLIKTKRQEIDISFLLNTNTK